MQTCMCVGIRTWRDITTAAATAAACLGEIRQVLGVALFAPGYYAVGEARERKQVYNAPKSQSL